MKKIKLYYFLWKLVGEDPQILDRTDANSKIRFLISGVIVALLFFLCFLSFKELFFNVFNINWLSVLLGSVFTIMIMNIYRLNLITLNFNKYTFNKSHLGALTIRFFFVAFIAILVSKPIELKFFDTLNEDWELAYRSNKIKARLNTIDDFYDFQLRKIEDEIQHTKEQVNTSQLSFGENKLALFRRLKERLLDEKSEAKIKTMYLYSKANLFINKLSYHCSNSFIGWVFTLLMIFLYSCPLLNKYFLSKNRTYYKFKMVSERKIIQESHTNFVVVYNEIFKHKFNLNIQYQNNYVDPPFNTKKKIAKITKGSEADFLNFLNQDEAQD